MPPLVHVFGQPRKNKNFKPKTDPAGRTWGQIHLDKVRSCPLTNIAFTGDSIIAGISRYPSVQRRYFQTINNLGIGGDRAEHVLWRTDDGALPASACAFVICCGTNNVNTHCRNPEMVATTIANIALRFRKVQPTCSYPHCWHIAKRQKPAVVLQNGVDI